MTDKLIDRNPGLTNPRGLSAGVDPHPDVTAEHMVWDCTICHSCRSDMLDATGLKHRENRGKKQESELLCIGGRTARWSESRSA